MGYGVEVPPQDCLLGGPGPIPLSQFIKGDGFFPVCICLIIGAEYPVDLTEEVPEQLAPLLGVSLEDGNEVVQVDIYVCCGGRALLLRELFPDASSWAYGAPASSATLASASCSSGCELATPCWSITLLERSANVSIAIQKYGALSTYPMER